MASEVLAIESHRRSIDLPTLVRLLFVLSFVLIDELVLVERIGKSESMVVEILGGDGGLLN